MATTAEIPRLPHRVVVVGGGFAGLHAARSLGIDPEVRLTLVDRRNFHLFQPLLYQVATGALSPGDIAQPLRSLVPQAHATRRSSSARPSASTSTGARSSSPTAGRSRTTRWSSRPGAHHTYFDHPEWAAVAPGLKTIEDATEIRRRILIAFEAAEREADPDRRRAWMTFVLVGGGPTGVELAGALGEIAHDTLRRDFRSIGPDETRIILVEAMDRVLPPYPPDRSVSAQRQLEKLGVEVRHEDAGGRRSTRTASGSTGPDGAEEAIEAKTVFWAAGVLTARFARTRRRGDRRPDRPRRPRPRRARPDRPRPPGDLRRRRRRGRAVEAGQGHARRRPGRDPGRQRTRPRSSAAGSSAGRTSRSSYSDHGDAAIIGRLSGVTNISWLGPFGPTGRVPGLGALARHPPVLPDRLLEPDRRPRPLGVDVPDPRPRDTADHRRDAPAADRGARAARTWRRSTRRRTRRGT